MGKDDGLENMTISAMGASLVILLSEWEASEVS